MVKLHDAIKTLNTGARFPQLGLGTWRSEPNKVAEAVEHALKTGYRHIDAALIYGNENEVGQGIKKAGIPRSELFVTTKLWNSDHKNAAAALDKSLKNLGLDYVDLYLMHWPIPVDENSKVQKDWDYKKTWHAMQKLDKSKVRAIGVSNVSVPFLEDLLKDPETTVTPACNQVELHPLLPQNKLVEACNKHDIAVTAYSPFGSQGSPILSNETIVGIAKRLNVKPSQVVISWIIQRGIIAIPKSVTNSRIEENGEKTAALSDEDIQAINQISEKHGIERYVKPDFGLDIGWEDFNVETGKAR